MNLGPIKDKTGNTMLRKKTVKKAFTVTAVFCVAAIAVTYAVSALNKPNNNLVLENPANTQTVISNGDADLTTQPPANTQIPDDNNENDSPASAGSSVTATMLLPVNEANVLKGYASDSLLYSSTLKHWATHNAIDFSCAEDSSVFSVLDGTISSVEEDALMGLTVKVSHDSGLETVYSCLKSVPDGIKEGASVLKGQAIGAVGNSGVSEADDGAHLHFEVLKDGKNVNPQNYLSNFTK
ncbi:MAG: M23 family metallopeptidase [Clostridiales bacterium]|nr:M23 family metallopeptidase [Clostridiales bacterium]